MKHLQEIAKQLDLAMLNAQPIHQFSQTDPFDLKEAYDVQRYSFAHRLGRGEKSVGYKLGFTSKAKMQQMGVHEIIWGRLTNKMSISAEGSLTASAFIHPRVEPEVAFQICQPIDEVLTVEEATAYIGKVAIALEVIDSRYEKFKFSLEDVVADNCSSAAYLLGDWLPAQTNIQGLPITLRVNGEVVQKGNSDAILGNPLEALVELSKMAIKYGEIIPSGSIILAGAATPAAHIKVGDRVEGHFGELGLLTFDVQ